MPLAFIAKKSNHGWSSWTIHGRHLPGVSLEEDLQTELDTPRDIALAMCQAEVAVAVVR